MLDWEARICRDSDNEGTGGGGGFGSGSHPGETGNTSQSLGQDHSANADTSAGMDTATQQARDYANLSAQYGLAAPQALTAAERRGFSMAAQDQAQQRAAQQVTPNPHAWGMPRSLGQRVGSVLGFNERAAVEENPAGYQQAVTQQTFDPMNSAIVGAAASMLGPIGAGLYGAGRFGYGVLSGQPDMAIGTTLGGPLGMAAEEAIGEDMDYSGVLGKDTQIGLGAVSPTDPVSPEGGYMMGGGDMMARPTDPRDLAGALIGRPSPVVQIQGDEYMARPGYTVAGRGTINQ